MATRCRSNVSFLALLLICAVLVAISIKRGADAMAAPGASSTSMPLRHRVALVSGGNKGIGKEIVRLLGSASQSANSQEKWVVFLGSRDEQRGRAAVEELSEALRISDADQTRIVCCPLDLTDKSSIEAAKDLVEREGNGALDVLINNAAICFNDPTLYGKVPHTPFEQQADITVRTNFFGTLDVTRAMLPLLERSPSPRIVNVASAAGRLAILKSDDLVRTFTSPDLRLSPQLESLMKEFVQDVESGIHASKGWPNTCYGMSKLGIIAMTRILARDYPRIMVNSVDPGYCATDQNNNQGVLPAERGAATPVALATVPAEEFVTGKHFYQEREIAW